jgi:metal-sulfur cluster biosynthetic enzyme
MDEQLLEALREVIDPELGINIVDLGLVYSAEMDEGSARVAMTLTTPACPMAGEVQAAAETVIWRCVPDVESVEVRLVWSPPWRPAMMSEEAKDEMGWFD